MYSLSDRAHLGPDHLYLRHYFHRPGLNAGSSSYLMYALCL